MPAVHLSIDKGGDYVNSFDVVGEDGLSIDLTGFACSSVVKKHESSAASWPFTAVANSSGIHLSMNEATTSSIPEGYYRYDVKLSSPDGATSYPIWGKVRVGPNVTP